MQTPTKPGTQTATDRTGKISAWVHGVSTFLLLGGFILAFTTLFTAPEANWPEATLLLLATLGTLTALSRQLPWQNVLVVAAIIGIIGSGVSALCARTAIPFGPLFFGPAGGPQLLKTLPWGMPFVWIVVVLNSRGVARLSLRPWRKTRTYGLWLMGLTAALVVLFELAFDPFASHLKHYWLWEQTKFPLTWQGAPITNFLSCSVVVLLMLAFATPMLINKQLSKRRKPDYHPLCVWLGAIVFCGVAAAMQGLWLVVAVDTVVAVSAAVFAIRGGRW
jgi:putative membrane protein